MVIRNLKYILPFAIFPLATEMQEVPKGQNGLENKTQKVELEKNNQEKKDQKREKKQDEFYEKIPETTPDENSMNWKELDNGLSVAKYAPEKKSKVGDSKITIVKVNPEEREMNLFSSKFEKEKHLRTAEEWAKEKGLSIAVNAGMFQRDGETNVGYMKVGDQYNNSHVNKYNTIAAFGAKEEDLPEFQIIDKGCQNWEEMKGKYEYYTQGIRMINCNRNNVWSNKEKMWSEMKIGEGEEGNAYFIHSRSPYPMDELNRILIKSPLELKNSMHLEGGPEASLYLNHKGNELKRIGSYETGFRENNFNRRFWDIPNIIGAK